ASPMRLSRVSACGWSGLVAFEDRAVALAAEQLLQRRAVLELRNVLEGFAVTRTEVIDAQEKHASLRRFLLEQRQDIVGRGLPACAEEQSGHDARSGDFGDIFEVHPFDEILHTRLHPVAQRPG